MNVWEIVILKSVRSLGGKAGLQQIYKELPDSIVLNEKNLRKSKWGEYPAYQDDVRSHIANLCQVGELTWISRGRYSLTERGIKRVDIEKKKRTFMGGSFRYFFKAT